MLILISILFDDTLGLNVKLGLSGVRVCILIALGFLIDSLINGCTKDWALNLFEILIVAHK